MKIKHLAVIVLSTLAALIFAPSEFSANAHGSGSGMHSFHSGQHFRHGRHNNRSNQWAPYGGLYALPPYGYDPNVGSAQPANVVYMLGSPRARSCQYVGDCDGTGRRRRDARRYSHSLLSESVQPFINSTTFGELLTVLPICESFLCRCILLAISRNEPDVHSNTSGAQYLLNEP